jgi:NADH:ubiquinone oxidoreductase subunit F (NADH-binding)
VSAFGTQMKEKMQEMMGGMMGAHMMGAHEKGGQSAEFNTALHADRHGRGDGPCGRP